MAEAAQSIIPTTAPNRSFEGHESVINAVAVLPDGRRMVTSSGDTFYLWDLKDGVVMKKMVGHRSSVLAVAVSNDGQLIASGDANGELIAWQGDTGELSTPSLKVRSNRITTLDFSPDRDALLASGYDWMVKLWSTNTWQVQGNPMNCGADVNCVRFSPSGELLAVATSKDIHIWDPRTRDSVAIIKAASDKNISLAWTPDGTRLLSAGSYSDRTIREWNASTWKQVGEPWRGHTDQINALAVNASGTLLASASSDNHVRLWRLSDRRNVAVFEHSQPARCVTFSADGKYILSGGVDQKVSGWAIPKAAFSEDDPEDHASEYALLEDATSKILPIYTMVRNACIIGDLPTAEELLTRHIEADGNNHKSYVNRSLVVARKCDWDYALSDAAKSVSIQPSLAGYISQGIALCGKKLLQDAMNAFDLAFMFTDGDSETILLLLLAITLFNANQHEDAILRIQQLATACPAADTLACCVVEAYLHVQLGNNALDELRHNKAVDHFTAAINSGAFSSEQAIHSKYEDFVVLFGWDLKSLWETANKKRCHALLRAGRLTEAHGAYRYMMDMSDEATTASCPFEQDCNALFTSSGDAALAAMDYDKAIELYSSAIDLNSSNSTDTMFEKRCRARLDKMLWEDALLDAQKIAELNPLSYLGHQLKHEALHGARRYDEAIAAFEFMLSKLNDSPDPQIRELRQQYITPPEAAMIIQEFTRAQLENSTPYRLLNTTGHVCDRVAQINTFKLSTEYKELLSSTMKHADMRMERIEKAVKMYFRCVMLSHRWEEIEPLLRDIQDKDISELDHVGGIAKLQSFCRTARDAGFRWAWVDTCCIDQNNIFEVQQSVNSMFTWYRHAALTIVYLSDVPPSSKSGALAKSVWNTRGWTVQEFLAPEVVLFYQQDWTLYLDDRSPNHKKSATIIQELADVTGIDSQSLVAFRPDEGSAREKLQWVSMRVTTLQEDIAYSLFGIFRVNLPVIYGEKKQNALGRLLQEVVAQSGDITCLNWVGKPSEFNSCLPANITLYKTLPSPLSSSSEDVMETSVLSLRDAGAVELASTLYTTLDQLPTPRFANRRLHLPCIVFAVTEVTPRPGQEDNPFFAYEVKADGLCDLLITTEDKLIPSPREMPIRPKLLLVRPRDRDLLEPDGCAEQFNLADDAQSTITEDYGTAPSSPLCDSPGMRPGENAPIDSEPDSRVSQMIIRLRQPFSAFLLAQQRGVEYKRIASEQNIIARVKDGASIRDVTDVRTLEIV
ncbi:hypothetical protein K503DRAFT_802760 [Rhizopogon vinicolor AM-OR11-026]|uniref:Heterokaryon incompatibility domain-containing protein n=1 Tax=Rhizopogon vinicolor AM-OR11-026 TaxID=1314800 RepID=A0A1B7MSH4_9AGAM|nr:hypothetical protein K503DRAFT_802760 [Rhizopogon vinicolor AM-OR11-026]